MALDPSIIMAGLRNQDAGTDIMQGMQFGQQMAAQRQAMQAQRLQLQEAQNERDRQAALDRALAQNPGNREAALAQLRSGNMGRAAEAQQQQWGKYDLEQAKIKKETLKADLESRMAQAERNAREAGAVLALHQQGKPDAAQSLYQTQARQRMQEGEDLSMLAPTYNPDALFGIVRQGVAAKDQLTQAFEQMKFESGEKEKKEKPLTTVAQLNADLKAGRITQDQFNDAYKDATTKGPGITVGLMAPQQGVDAGGNPVFFQPSKAGGNAQIIPNVSPMEKHRPVPSSVVTDFITNEGILDAIEGAKSEVEKRPGAFGPANMVVPDVIRQRTDPEGVTGRALVSQVGSMKYKTMSGSAVTISEDKRLTPYIPRLHDSPETVKKKLDGLAKEIRNIQSGFATAYTDGYQAIPQFGKYTGQAKTHEPSQSAFTPKFKPKKAIPADVQAKMDRAKANGASGAEIEAALKKMGY